MRKVALLFILCLFAGAVEAQVNTHTPVNTPYVDITLDNYSTTDTSFTVPSAFATATVVPNPGVMGTVYAPLFNSTMYPNGPVFGRADYEVVKPTAFSSLTYTVERAQAGTSIKSRKAGTYKMRYPVGTTFTPTKTSTPSFTPTFTHTFTSTFTPTFTPTFTHTFTPSFTPSQTPIPNATVVLAVSSGTPVASFISNPNTTTSTGWFFTFKGTDPWIAGGFIAVNPVADGVTVMSTVAGTYIWGIKP